MKKIILGLVVLTTTIMSQAQVRFGIQAGAVIGSTRAEFANVETNSDSRIGMTLGVTADVPISENFIFNPALNFVQKGGKTEETESGITTTDARTLSVIEIPLNFVYRSGAESGFFGGLGPVVSIGVGGKDKHKEEGDGVDIEEESDITFGDAMGETKRLEFGGNVLAGYQLANGVYIAANYNMGFSNLAGGDIDGLSAKTSYFGIRVGFKFGGGATARK